MHETLFFFYSMQKLGMNSFSKRLTNGVRHQLRIIKMRASGWQLKSSSLQLLKLGGMDLFVRVIYTPFTFFFFLDLIWV